jgi:3-dehydroquinate dehydratase
VLTSELAKKVILFAMFFVATRDVIASFTLCIVYVLVVDGLFHERRKFSVVKDMVPATAVGVGEAEYKRAVDVVARYEKQGTTTKNEQGSAYDTYLQNLSTLRV